MLNRLYCGIASALLACVALAPSARASSIDIGQITPTVTDTAGALSSSKTGAIINISNLSGDMITAGNFSLNASFNTVTNAFNSGSFSLLGTLRDSSMTSLGTITFGGTLTGLTQNGNALLFTFNTTTPGSPTAADTILDSAFGPKGVVQLTLSGAPGGFALGGTFSTTGVNTVDITSVPTPNAMSAGLLLLGGMAAFGARRSLKLS